MADSLRIEPTGKSWADMVEEDEINEPLTESQDENIDDSKETPPPDSVTIETNDETKTDSQTSGGRWDSLAADREKPSAPVSRWAALDADRTHPRSSFNQHRNDPYQPTGGRLNRSVFEDSAYDNRNGGFQNRNNFSNGHRYREYHELNREDETPEVKKAIAAWNNYQPNDESDEENNQPKGPANPSNYPYNVVLITPQQPAVSQKKELPYDEKAARAATHSANFSFSWADDMSDTSDNEEEDLLRLLGKAPDQDQNDTSTSPVKEKINPPQNLSDPAQPAGNGEVREEAVITDTEDQQPVLEKKEEQDQSIAEEKKPVIEKEEHIAEEKEPVVEEKESVVEEKEPVVEEKEPTANKGEPVVEEENTKRQEEEPATEKKETKMEEEESIVEKEEHTTKETELIAKKEDCAEKKAEPVVEEERTVTEEKPVYKWGVLDDYKEFEAKKSEPQPAVTMSKEQEAEAVAAWHALKVPVDEEETRSEQTNSDEWQKEAGWTQTENVEEEEEEGKTEKEQGGSDKWQKEASWAQFGEREAEKTEKKKEQTSSDEWQKEASWTQTASSSWQQPDTPEQTPSVSINSSDTTDWNQPNESTVQNEGWQSNLDQETDERQKTAGFKDSWRNKIQPVKEDNSMRWKSFAETSNVVETKRNDRGPSYALPTTQPVISQPEPKPSVPQEVSFSLSNFQEEPKKEKTTPTISLNWGEFAQQEDTTTGVPSSISVSTNKESGTHQATISLYDPPEPVVLRLSEIYRQEPVQLRLEDMSVENVQLEPENDTKPVQHVQLKLSDFTIEKSPPKQPEERNPDAWGSVSQDAFVRPQRMDVPTGTSQPRRKKIQMGGAQWAHLQKNLLANKK
ncbi:hypothetical protein A0J61_05715 [Choanephora cucurbitarum]|uniref:Uncharacterized protein n=1 Tax=Choanephora cucurbitarum TaxID=101091 RepID=A0A1C7NAX3_9FUNG|nr:hypothetical protein A0J61_05715 [Choanephora cucurbitarum]